ncbi:MAG: hypothetical protein JWQ43_917 [Glaciihabitans sp.]|nr:hypothetical protein [Glaciihabitans sp.]
MANQTPAPSHRLRGRALVSTVIAFAGVATALGLSACTGITTGSSSVTDTRAAAAAGVEGEWSPVPDSPLSARRETAGAWLDGAFFIFGGTDSETCVDYPQCYMEQAQSLTDGARFDPQSQEWTAIADAPGPVGDWNTVVADDVFYILAVDWSTEGPDSSFLRYNPVDDQWTELPAPPTPYAWLRNAGDRVVAIGTSDEEGRATDSVFDPATDTWSALPADPVGSSFDREAVWTGDRLMLFANPRYPDFGVEGPYSVRVAALDGTLRDWSILPDTEMIGDYPVTVGERVVFPYRWEEANGVVDEWGGQLLHGGILDPTDLTVTPLPDEWMADPSGGSGGTLANTPGIAVVGDRLYTPEFGQLLEPVTGTVADIPRIPSDEQLYAPTVLANDDTIFVWGGVTNGVNVGSGHVLRVPSAD